MKLAKEFLEKAIAVRTVCRCIPVLLASVISCANLIGCASLTNPVANGTPVQRVPPELLGESKENLETIPLTSLRQPPPAAYELDANDVLGIWIEGILGEKGQLPVVQVSGKGNLPPAIGYPIVVRADGTITLPYVDPIKVRGMTLAQAEAAIRKSYTVDKKILQPERERIFVSLQQPRHYHILVIRQDSGNDTSGSDSFAGSASTGFVVSVGRGATGTRGGRGFAIDLPAYENDVLNALAVTGGFPGSDAVNEIIIERGIAPNVSRGKGDLNVVGSGRQTIRIPLRVRKGEQPNIPPEAITLQTGDTVYIEARESDVYYTGGLLPPGSWRLPRDVDLDVVQAILLSRGAINSGGLSALNIAGTTTGTGLGNPSPSLVTVLRRTPNGKQVAIRVDLNCALRDPRERILIQPRDIILLQEMPQQAVARYVSGIVHFDWKYLIQQSDRSVITSTVGVP